MGKDWIGNSKSIYTTLGASNHTDKEREQNDYYATDPIAAINTNRKCICIEKDDKYFELGSERVRKHLDEQKSRLF